MKFKSLAFISLSVGVATAALAIGTGRLSPVDGRERGDGAGRRRRRPRVGRASRPERDAAGRGLHRRRRRPRAGDSGAGRAPRRAAPAPSYRVDRRRRHHDGQRLADADHGRAGDAFRRSRRSARPRDRRPVPRRRRRLRQCRGHDPHPLRQCQGLRQSRGLLHLPQPAFPRRISAPRRLHSGLQRQQP